MSIRMIAHSIRNGLLPVAARRPFNPIQQPEQRLLLVRPDHFGDLLLLGPALRLIEELATDQEHLLLTGPWNRTVAAHIAPSWKRYEWSFPGFDRQRPSDSGMLDPYRQVGAAAEFVRELAPETIVLTRDDHWWGAWMAREAGVPIRIGYDHPLLRPFLTHPIPIDSRHYVEQNMQLARAAMTILGSEVPAEHELRAEQHPLFWPRDSDADRGADTLIKKYELGQGFVVVHPGSGAQVKLWTSARWAQVIERVQQSSGLPVVLTGTEDEVTLCTAIAEATDASVSNIAGQTSLFSLAELFRSASIVLGVDSGPLHLACAVGTPSIHLFGPSDHTRYGPWGDPAKHRVISAGMSCPDCGNLAASRPAGCGCMMAITVDDVSETAIEMLRNAR
jgi:heptosyltransferase III